MTGMARAALVLTAVTLGCSDYGSALAGEGLADLQEPVTYGGVLRPCPDCWESTITLTLRPDGTFFLREQTETYEAVDLGRWELDESRTSLILLGGRVDPYRFVASDLSRLRLLDPDGLPVEVEDGQVPELSLAGVDRFGESLRLQGKYWLQEGDVFFAECRTGVPWQVASEGASGDLEQAYWRLEREPGKYPLAKVTGRLEQRPREGGGTGEVLVVETLHAVARNKGCPIQAHRGPVVPARTRRPSGLPPRLRRWITGQYRPFPYEAPTRDTAPEELDPDDPLRRIQKPPVPTDPRTTSG